MLEFPAPEYVAVHAASSGAYAMLGAGLSEDIQDNPQDTPPSAVGGRTGGRVAGEGDGISSSPPSPPTPLDTHINSCVNAFADYNAGRDHPDQPQMESYFVRLFSNEVPDTVRARSKADTYAILDTAGPDYFLEEIARGSIPVELAFRYELPLIFFMKWLEERVDEEDYAYAMGLCADTLAAKSRVALETSPSNATNGAMIREYARRSLELAERIAPDGWSGSKKASSATETKAPMQIAIIMAPGSAPIPGTELLVAARPFP